MGGGTTESTLISFLPMIGIFVLFYFLMIRPQQKRAKAHKRMLQSLQKNDEVITTAGIVGKVTKTDEVYITLEISNNVEIQVQRGAIATRLEKEVPKSV